MNTISGCSLIITTYNWPRALELCVRSAMLQTQLPDEILIADDGSGQCTAALINELKLKSFIPIKHIWQKDDGFRLAKIRNKAIAAASHDYIIQVDGDVILDRNFISDHLSIARKDYFIVGSRTNLSQRVSKGVINGPLLADISCIMKETRFKLNSWRNKVISHFLSNKYKVEGKNKFYSKGCNMAYWKLDALEVNGYNERIYGWGSEDEEFVVRLFKAGKRKMFLKMGGVVFHLWHENVSRDNEGANKGILNSVLRQKEKVCELGIGQYL